MQSKPKTYIVDIDGCLLYHHGKGAAHQWDADTVQQIEGTLEFFNRIESTGSHVVLITARPECLREELVLSLRRLGIFWHQLVMGVTSGERILINDAKPGGAPSARAIVIERNSGLKGVQ